MRVRVWFSLLVALLAASLAVVPAGASPSRSDQLERLGATRAVDPDKGQCRPRRTRIETAEALERARVGRSRPFPVDADVRLLSSRVQGRHAVRDASPPLLSARGLCSLAGRREPGVFIGPAVRGRGRQGVAAVAPHREDMLSPEWREVGIGALHADSAGGAFKQEAVWVVTMDFGARTPW